MSDEGRGPGSKSHREILWDDRLRKWRYADDGSALDGVAKRKGSGGPFWWSHLPQDNDSADPFTPRCQKCGSYAVAVRRSGRELVIGCKDCGRSVSHHSREKAWEFFLRPLMPERDLDRVSKAYAQAAIDERRAETTLERRIRHLAVLNNPIAAPGESYAADYTDRLCSRHLVLRRLRDGRRDGVLSVDKTPETLMWELKEKHAEDS